MILEEIHTGADLKKLSYKQEKQLAQEIRDVIISTVSRNGGHLASNLGSVELTIALHRVFDLPKDKLVFDVGHQAYAHKLLTGRLLAFRTLRKQGGLSGFLRPSESPYDTCMTGHASSSISTALGIARARDYRKEDYNVVAVIGDGALTGGMAYEALNDAGQSKTRLIVVLNDNEMSISRNVGALSHYLTHLRQSTPYRTFKQSIRTLLGNDSHKSGTLRFLERFRDAIKTLFVDGQFFDTLGFEYEGPIDGHNIHQLENVLNKAKKSYKPVLIHVVTHKGQGYPPARERPDAFHGVAPFFVETGEALQKSVIGYGRIASEELCRLAIRDKRICVITAAMKSGTGMEFFEKLFPGRLYDVGIAEEHAVSMAAGMALNGLRPYVAIYSTFLQRAFDQIMMDICLQHLPVVFLIDRAGFVGSDGPTHQGAFDLSYLCMMPGMIVAAPRDVRDLRRLIQLSEKIDGPMAIRYPREALDMGSGMEEKQPLHVGEWELLTDGNDVLILATGRMVEIALTACIELNGKNCSCGVIDARFIKPLDEKMLRWAASHVKLLVTLEEATPSGGLGAQTLLFLSGDRDRDRDSYRTSRNPDGNPDVKADGKPDMKADGKPNAKADGNPDMKAAGKPDAKADGNPDMKAAGNPDAVVNGKPDTTDAKAYGKPDEATEGASDSEYFRSFNRNARADVLTLGIPDHFVQQGSISWQMEDSGLSCEKISERILQRLEEIRHGNDPG